MSNRLYHHIKMCQCKETPSTPVHPDPPDRKRSLSGSSSRRRGRSTAPPGRCCREGKSGGRCSSRRRPGGCCTATSIPGEFFPEGEFRLFGGLRPDVAEAVGDPVHMGVHAETGPVETERDDQIGRLSPHPLERQELVECVRDAGMKAVDQIAADMPDRLGLVPVESDGVDRLAGSSLRKAGASLRASRPGRRAAPLPTAVTSSLVRRLRSVEIRISKGSRCSSASWETMGSSRLFKLLFEKADDLRHMPVVHGCSPAPRSANRSPRHWPAYPDGAWRYPPRPGLPSPSYPGSRRS